MIFPSSPRPWPRARVPNVPAEPPRLQPGISAARWMRLIYVLWGVGIVAVVALFFVGRRVDFALIGPVIFVVSMLVVGPSFLIPWRMLNTARAEARHGYTTLGGTMMTSPKGELDPYWLKNRRRVQFDFAGLWHLDSSGNVKLPPDRQLDPPGFYPSPHAEHDYELWTGQFWTGNYVPVARQLDGTTRSPVAWDHFQDSVRSGVEMIAAEPDCRQLAGQ